MKPFWQGFFSAFGLCEPRLPSLRHYGMSLKEWRSKGPKGDAEAIKKDWEAVGGYLQWAMDKVKKEIEEA